MSIRKTINKLNPLIKIRSDGYKKKLVNKDFSILCPSCIGGMISHDLGQRFLSPTVNTMMLQSDFIKFVLNLEGYLNGRFEFFKHREYTCPCAYLKSEGLDDIIVHFTHYKTPEEGETKWIERAKRINYDNIFVVLSERDGVTKEDIEELKKLKYKGIAVFTAHNYPDIPYAIYMKKYSKDGIVGNVLSQSIITGKHEYEKIFDFVKWFNEANGGNYDVSKYIKKKG